MTMYNDGLGVIRLGDKSSHGGVVISASGFPDMGKAIALVGDMVQCPKCRGTFPIVEGASNCDYNGTPIAFHGNKTGCGAALISSWGVKGASVSQVASAIGSTLVTAKAFNDYFRLADDETGEPLAFCEYVVRRADGLSEYGVTDAQGYTHLVGNTNDAEGIRIEMGDWEDSNE